MNYELYIPRLINRDLKTGKFIKGMIPWNKNKKFPNSNIGGSTKFKKGNIPSNTKRDGLISKRWHKGAKEYYIYIRISQGKWQLLQRYIWEKQYGKISDNHVVRFKNKNDDFSIDNLECISRTENMIRNRNRKKAAESMKKLWRMEKIRQIYELPRKTKLRIA